MYSLVSRYTLLQKKCFNHMKNIRNLGVLLLYDFVAIVTIIMYAVEFYHRFDYGVCKTCNTVKFVSLAVFLLFYYGSGQNFQPVFQNIKRSTRTIWFIICVLTYIPLVTLFSMPAYVSEIHIRIVYFFAFVLLVLSFLCYIGFQIYFVLNNKLR